MLTPEARHLLTVYSFFAQAMDRTLVKKSRFRHQIIKQNLGEALKTLSMSVGSGIRLTSDKGTNRP